MNYSYFHSDQFVIDVTLTRSLNAFKQNFKTLMAAAVVNIVAPFTKGVGQESQDVLSQVQLAPICSQLNQMDKWRASVLKLLIGPLSRRVNILKTKLNQKQDELDEARLGFDPDDIKNDAVDDSTVDYIQTLENEVDLLKSEYDEAQLFAHNGFYKSLTELEADAVEAIDLIGSPQRRIMISALWRMEHVLKHIGLLVTRCRKYVESGTCLSENDKSSQLFVNDLQELQYLRCVIANPSLDYVSNNVVDNAVNSDGGQSNNDVKSNDVKNSVDNKDVKSNDVDANANVNVNIDDESSVSQFALMENTTIEDVKVYAELLFIPNLIVSLNLFDHVDVQSLINDTDFNEQIREARIGMYKLDRFGNMTTDEKRTNANSWWDMHCHKDTKINDRLNWAATVNPPIMVAPVCTIDWFRNVPSVNKLVAAAAIERFYRLKNE